MDGFPAVAWWTMSARCPAPPTVSALLGRARLSATGCTKRLSPLRRAGSRAAATADGIPRPSPVRRRHVEAPVADAGGTVRPRAERSARVRADLGPRRRHGDGAEEDVRVGAGVGVRCPREGARRPGRGVAAGALFGTARVRFADSRRFQHAGP